MQACQILLAFWPLPSPLRNPFSPHLPAPFEVFPVGSETLPAFPEALPAVSEFLPATSETLPIASETQLPLMLYQLFDGHLSFHFCLSIYKIISVSLCIFFFLSFFFLSISLSFSRSFSLSFSLPLLSSNLCPTLFCVWCQGLHGKAREDEQIHPWPYHLLPSNPPNCYQNHFCNCYNLAAPSLPSGLSPPDTYPDTITTTRDPLHLSLII